MQTLDKYLKHRIYHNRGSFIWKVQGIKLCSRNTKRKHLFGSNPQWNLSTGTDFSLNTLSLWIILSIVKAKKHRVIQIYDSEKQIIWISHTPYINGMKIHNSKLLGISKTRTTIKIVLKFFHFKNLERSSSNSFAV